MTGAEACVVGLAGASVVGVMVVAFVLGRRAGERRRGAEHAMFSFALVGNIMTMRKLMEDGREGEVRVMLESLGRVVHDVWRAEQECLTEEERGRLKETVTAEAVARAEEEFASGGPKP